MRVEIPTCTRCCFCVPLRQGILISGYFNLLYALTVVCLETTISIQYSEQSSNTFMAFYKGVMFYCQAWFPVILYTLEIIFSIILIVGAHKKRMDFLRAFYYYSLFTTLTVLVIFLVVRYDEHYKNIENYLFEFSLAFCGFVFQIYILLLIRSELKRTKNSNRLSFVNHVSEVVVDGPIAEGRNPL